DASVMVVIKDVDDRVGSIGEHKWTHDRTAVCGATGCCRDTCSSEACRVPAAGTPPGSANAATSPMSRCSPNRAPCSSVVARFEAAERAPLAVTATCVPARTHPAATPRPDPVRRAATRSHVFRPGAAESAPSYATPASHPARKSAQAAPLADVFALLEIPE